MRCKYWQGNGNGGRRQPRPRPNAIDPYIVGEVEDWLDDIVVKGWPIDQEFEVLRTIGEWALATVTNVEADSVTVTLGDSSTKSIPDRRLIALMGPANLDGAGEW